MRCVYLRQDSSPRSASVSTEVWGPEKAKTVNGARKDSSPQNTPCAKDPGVGDEGWGCLGLGAGRTTRTAKHSAEKQIDRAGARGFGLQWPSCFSRGRHADEMRRVRRVRRVRREHPKP
mmetsp:Transcript_16841/g.26097  ORF Transcript_16841/g.26097 Transcript_16841/m.26097 type:complete len:119 (-) Transcript_16841:11-367(-)